MLSLYFMTVNIVNDIVSLTMDKYLSTRFMFSKLIQGAKHRVSYSDLSVITHDFFAIFQ
jgi:hypothetical protein